MSTDIIYPSMRGLQPTGDDLAGYVPGNNYYGTNREGHIALWIGFGIFSGAAGLFLISTIQSKSEKVRKFSVTNMMINAIAATAYLTMAMEEGFYVRATPGGWWVYWARYIDWTFTTPLLLIDLANLAGAPMTLTIAMVFFDILMIITGLFGALSSNAWTLWLWFAFGCVAFLPLYYFTAIEFRRYTHVKVNKAYSMTSVYLLTVWTLYPIAWGVGEGAELISNDAFTVWILVLDLTAKAVFGSIIVYLYRDILPYSEGNIADRPIHLKREPDMWGENEEDNIHGIDPRAGLRNRYATDSTGYGAVNTNGNSNGHNVELGSSPPPSTQVTGGGYHNASVPTDTGRSQVV